MWSVIDYCLMTILTVSIRPRPHPCETCTNRNTINAVSLKMYYDNNQYIQPMRNVCMHGLALCCIHLCVQVQSLRSKEEEEGAEEAW